MRWSPAIFTSLSAPSALSASAILRAVLALIAGMVALAWPAATVLAPAILFAVYAFIDAASKAVRGFGNATAGRVVGYLLPGLADLAAGVIAVLWPRPTALVLMPIVGVWAVTGGCAEMFAMMGRPCREKRLLNDMEEALRRSAPHLASMAATFAAMVAKEPMPDHEDLRPPTWR